jgi:hypothetical protein
MIKRFERIMVAHEKHFSIPCNPSQNKKNTCQSHVGPHTDDHTAIPAYLGIIEMMISKGSRGMVKPAYV